MLLERTRVGPVAVLTLNRPEVRNALSGALIEELTQGLSECADDDAVRAVVLTGAGEKAFCAGMDLRDFAQSDRAAFSQDAPGDTDGDATARGQHAAATSPVIPWDYPKPLVAAVNGAAVAGGFELMMACDLVVAAEHAVFGLAEVKRGLLPGGGGTMLATRLPLAFALELTLVGDPIDAHRALAVGLVNRVVPADRVLSEALDLAGRIAANGPLAVRAIKQLVRGGVEVGPPAAWPHRELLDRVFGSEDALEGARAFVEKRPPNFQGR